MLVIKMDNDIALSMILNKRVREPTLNQVNQEAESGVVANMKFKSIPAWLHFSEPHPGLPEHYLVKSLIDKYEMSTVSDDFLPELPFEVNREIIYKLIIIPKQGYCDVLKPVHVGSVVPNNEPLHAYRLMKFEPFSEPADHPSLDKMMNGTIAVVGKPFPDDKKHNVEIFLYLHKMLLPVAYCPLSEVIITSTLTPNGKARCYYIPDESDEPMAMHGANSSYEMCFITADEQIIFRNNYRMEWLPGCCPFYNIESAIAEPKTLPDDYIPFDNEL